MPSLSIPGFSFLKPKDSFAIDIGTSSIKIVFLKKTGNRYGLEKWAVLPVGEAGPELSPQDRRNVTVSRIAEFLSKEKLLVRNVAGSVSGNQVIVRYVRFPKLSREELMKTIQFEAEPYIPFDIKEVDLSFHVYGEVMEDNQKKMETILAAAKKEAIQSKVDIFNELGLRAVVMDIDAFALSNAYTMSAEEGTAETVLLINIGAGVTTMSIVHNGIPRVVRDVLIAGNAFTKAIQRGMSCDIKTAEGLKSRYRLLVTAEEKEKTLAENQKEMLQVSSAMTPVAKDLLGEIQRSIDFYTSQNPEHVVNRVLLCGGTAELKNLDQYLNRELKLPVEMFNPLKNVFGGETVPENVAPLLAIATGLALRHENDIPKK